MIDSWSQMVIKHTADTVDIATEVPETGIYRMKEDGSIDFNRFDYHRRAVESENEAFFLRILQPGDYRYEGADIGILVTRGRSMTNGFKLTERAKRARAVNTLVKQSDGRILGDTTDGEGLLYDLETLLKWTLYDRNVLILGAGGAVRGVLETLLSRNPANLVLANRTLAKAEELTDDFPEISPSSFTELSGRFDLIINGTSAGLSGNLPPLPDGLITPDTHCYDMSYSKDETAFNRWARSQGAQHCSDGLGMLVGQAAVSFQLWRGLMPETLPVLELLREELS
jgi:shikimate dehydrogenase